jgi:FkbM family methyltransferase
MRCSPLSRKTRTLNQIRRIFQLPVLEKTLRVGTERWPNSVLRKLIPPEYLYAAGSVRRIERHGVRYELDVSHVVDHYLYFGIQDADYSSVEPEIRRARVILDIGGNIGTTALLFGNLNSNAVIHSFEPHPSNLARAQKNFGLNKFSGIVMHPFGLGATAASFKLYEVDAHNPGMNRILPGAQRFPFVDIEVRKLDDVVNVLGLTTVDFVKIDVEGFEYAVLEGARHTLKKFQPTLFVELDDGHLQAHGKTAAELVTLLNTLGYSKIRRATTGEVIQSDSRTLERCHFDIVAQAPKVMA